eukprot:GHVP01045557.1.p1 GENE.GHVP01045557.1~~GHVP01045557.1.p1  ORF type:complete len:488 (+),score=72.21 GHVP01045557.1:470-1933(+)
MKGGYIWEILLLSALVSSKCADRTECLEVVQGRVEEYCGGQVPEFYPKSKHFGDMTRRIVATGDGEPLAEKVIDGDSVNEIIMDTIYYSWVSYFLVISFIIIEIIWIGCFCGAACSASCRSCCNMCWWDLCGVETPRESLKDIPVWKKATLLTVAMLFPILGIISFGISGGYFLTQVNLIEDAQCQSSIFNYDLLFSLNIDERATPWEGLYNTDKTIGKVIEKYEPDTGPEAVELRQISTDLESEVSALMDQFEVDAISVDDDTMKQTTASLAADYTESGQSFPLLMRCWICEGYTEGLVTADLATRIAEAKSILDDIVQEVEDETGAGGSFGEINESLVEIETTQLDAANELVLEMNNNDDFTQLMNRMQKVWVTLGSLLIVFTVPFALWGLGIWITYLAKPDVSRSVMRKNHYGLLWVSGMMCVATAFSGTLLYITAVHFFSDVCEYGKVNVLEDGEWMDLRMLDKRRWWKYRGSNRNRRRTYGN